MILLIKYFKLDNEQRHKEYLTCLQKNLDNQFFEKIFILKENLTFKDYFEFCNRFEGEICVVANGDIIFDERIGILNQTDLEGVFVALARGDKQDSASSQDVWAFKAPIKVRDDMNFGFGKPGNDNRIARIMYELGYEVRNPAKQIRTIHLHESNFRPNLEWDKVPGPYLCVVPNDDITKKSDYILTDNLW